MSDSDDDLPISEFIKKRKREAALSSSAASAKVKAEPSEKAEIASKQPKTEKNAKVSEKSTEKSTKSHGMGRSNEFYEDTKKGELVQKLLIRWWYAMDPPKTKAEEQLPAGYESLDGYPGVYISTRTDSLGKIVDIREGATKPSLSILSRMSSQRLKELCIAAYTKQMEVLKEHEGDDIALYRSLKSELSEVKRIDTDKADKEAKKYIF